MYAQKPVTKNLAQNCMTDYFLLVFSNTKYCIVCTKFVSFVFLSTHDITAWGKTPEAQEQLLGKLKQSM